MLIVVEVVKVSTHVISFFFQVILFRQSTAKNGNMIILHLNSIGGNPVRMWLGTESSLKKKWTSTIFSTIEKKRANCYSPRVALPFIAL